LTSVSRVERIRATVAIQPFWWRSRAKECVFVEKSALAQLIDTARRERKKAKGSDEFYEP